MNNSIRQDRHPVLCLPRNLDRLYHHPLHFFSANQRLQENAELHRAQFQQSHHLGESFRRQCLPVRIDVEIIEICKAPSSAPTPSSPTLLDPGPQRRHGPRLRRRRRAECGSRYGLLHARRGDGRHLEKALIQARLARGSWFHPIVARIRPSGLESGSLT